MSYKLELNYTLDYHVQLTVLANIHLTPNCKPCMVAATVNKTLTRLRFGGAQSKNSALQKQGAVCGL